MAPPTTQLGEREGDSDAFNARLKELKLRVEEHSRKLGPALDVWVGFKPGQKRKIWLGAPGDLPEAARTAMLDELAQISVPDVRGLIVVVLRFNRTQVVEPVDSVMRPTELTAAARGRTMELEDVIVAAWPD